MVEELDVLNVGIFGHIDHGKTTLLYRLSGKWADEHSEELKRGITIRLGYADIIIKRDKEGRVTKEKDVDGKPIRQITFIDSPGHEILMATMLSGAAIIDAALLVVAANEGIKPQTREHFIALKAKKVPYLIVVQNKIDIVSKEQALKNFEEIKKLLKNTIYENSPIIPISAQQNINIDILLEELCKIPIPNRNKKDTPIFFVARSFDINRPGTKINELKGGVLGGTIKSGIFRVNDKIEILPGRQVKKNNQIFYEKIKTKIVSIMRGSINLKEAGPGGSISLETSLDPSLTKSDFLVGRVVSLEGKLPSVKNFVKIKYSLFEEILGIEEHMAPDKIRTNEILMLSINCSTTVGSVKEVQKDFFSIDLKVPIVPIIGESVGIARNINGHWRLIGQGEVVT
ncbi:MAG: translation initiation factor IF-2 subunit gamma [Candidatus Pacearchaeota archaeon]